MPSSSLRVLYISAQEHGSGLKSMPAKVPRLLVHAQVRVGDQLDRFDQVRIRFQGAVKVRIGSKVDLEMLPSTTQVRSVPDFKPPESPSQTNPQQLVLDFVIPTSSPTNAPPRPMDSPASFVPSMSLSGSTHFTHVTALKDRHILSGACQVLYWLEADFVQSQPNKVVQKLTCTLDLPGFDTALDVMVARKSSKETMERIIRPKPSSWTFGLSPQRQRQRNPEISIRLPYHLGTIASLPTTGRQLSIPVLIELKFPGTSQQVPFPTLKSKVKAVWYITETFAAGTTLNNGQMPSYVGSDSVVQNKRVTSQRIDMNLPPLYQPDSYLQHISAPSGSQAPPSSQSQSDIVQHQRYEPLHTNCDTTTTATTTAFIDLLLPSTVCGPSVSTKLLRIDFSLDLSIQVAIDVASTYRDADKHPDRSMSLYGLHMRPAKARFKLPLTLSARQPESRSLGPLAGLVERGLVNAPPPYVCVV